MLVLVRGAGFSTPRGRCYHIRPFAPRLWGCFRRFVLFWWPDPSALSADPEDVPDEALASAPQRGGRQWEWFRRS
eukprot:5760890-Pyramimonas_sp.AAC.1